MQDKAQFSIEEIDVDGIMRILNIRYTSRC